MSTKIYIQDLLKFAGFQANNQITTAAALNYMHEKTSNCKVKCDYDYYIIPLVNPDGYTYALKNKTWSHAKNMEPTSNASCKGVNVLYNFKNPSQPGDSNPCSQTYQGPAPMSAVETKYLTVIKKNVKNVVLTLVAEQTEPTQGKGIIIAPYFQNTPKDAYKPFTDAFMAGLHEVNPFINYTVAGIKDLQNGTVFHYNQNNFGNTFGISMPAFSYPQVARREISFKEFSHGVEKMLTTV